MNQTLGGFSEKDPPHTTLQRGEWHWIGTSSQFSSKEGKPRPSLQEGIWRSIVFRSRVAVHVTEMGSCYEEGSCLIAQVESLL